MKGLARSLGRNPAAAPIVKQTIKVKAKAISVVGASGVGFGSAVLGDLPAGNILLLGAVSYLRVTNADADAQATFDGDYSIGTTATADVTLSGTDVNIIPSTALGAATAGVSPVVRGASTAAPAILDNTDGSLEVNVNLLIDDANISGTADMTLDGHVVISYVVLSDD